MKPMKRIFATILMLCMAFTLVACGNASNGDTEKNSQNTESQNSQASNSENSEADTTVEDGKVVYKVTVVDEGGNPVAGAMVQVCDSENCYAPKATDASGVAEFSLEEADDYHTKLVTNPAGYEAIETDYVYFENGATEVTLTVKAVQ